MNGHGWTRWPPIVPGSISTSWAGAGQPQSVSVRMPRGITYRPWTWTSQPDLVTGSIESAANAMIVSSSARSGSSWCLLTPGS